MQRNSCGFKPGEAVGMQKILMHKELLGILKEIKM